MTSDRHSLFVHTLEFLFRAHISIRDPFFASRLSERLYSLILLHIQHNGSPREQRTQGREYFRACKETSLLLEQIAHVGSGDPVLIRTAQERLLSYARHVIMDIKNIPVEPAVRPSVSSQQATPLIQSAQASRPKPTNRNKTQEQILEFVKRVPECRPKDIIGEFNALSQRTVKRSLKELSEMGLIVKKTNEDKAVYYSAVSS